MARPLALSAYLGATRLLEGWAERRVEARVEAGKEDAERLTERFGHGSRPRPDGPLAWFHAASVGESLSILELIRRIGSAYPGMSLLVTTGTRTSAQLLAARLPKGVIHQYVPVDTNSAVKRFLDHWRPDLALWTESELWPRLVTETAARGTPMLLINARISEASAKRWRWLGGMSAAVVGCFDAVLVQDDEIGERFAAIGTSEDKIAVTGSLKEGAAPLPVDDGLLFEFQSAVGERPVWLAASTHDGEEGEVIAAHQLLLRRYPNLLMILAPRHPERGGDIAAMLERAGLSFGRRSRGAMPEPGHSVYLADSLGEMGLWYRLAPVSFVGGSLEAIGGHNPYEPALLGSAILHGPHIHNFQDIYDRLAAAGGTVEVTAAEGLATAVTICQGPARLGELSAAAWAVCDEGSGVTDRVMAHIAPYLEGLTQKAAPAAP